MSFFLLSSSTWKSIINVGVDTLLTTSMEKDLSLLFLTITTSPTFDKEACSGQASFVETNGHTKEHLLTHKLKQSYCSTLPKGLEWICADQKVS